MTSMRIFYSLKKSVAWRSCEQIVDTVNDAIIILSKDN